MKSVVIAGSKGIGKAIADELKKISDTVIAASRDEIDTSDLDSVRAFVKKHPKTDVLVLNTGGPAAAPFEELTEELWIKYFKQLFLSFVIIMQNIKVSDGGYVFLISSFNIKEPNQKLIPSNSLRLGFTSVFKSLSKLNMEKKISFINIAPGPTETDRLIELQKKSNRTLAEFAQTLPTKRVADPKDIGKFVRSVVENRITSLNGVTINFDMGLSNYVL